MIGQALPDTDDVLRYAKFRDILEDGTLNCSAFQRRPQGSGLYAREIAVNLIALHDGELVGRTRLQKRAYLLHRCGAEFTLNFVYPFLT
jgi:hypothetical protein